MKLVFLILEGKSPDWVERARKEYQEKVSHFAQFEIKSIKSPNADRDSAQVKTRLEGELILKNVDDKDFLVVFDETGKSFKTSEDFSLALAKVLESGKSRITFCIGGPYGFAESVRARAQAKWSLSGLTFNHWIASLVALEQIYRGFTILKGIPYHNR